MRLKNKHIPAGMTAKAYYITGQKEHDGVKFFRQKLWNV
jgi:hypothetical protein